MKLVENNSLSSNLTDEVEIHCFVFLFLNFIHSDGVTETKTFREKALLLNVVVLIACGRWIKCRKQLHTMIMLITRSVVEPGTYKLVPAA